MKEGCDKEFPYPNLKQAPKCPLFDWPHPKACLQSVEPQFSKNPAKSV